MGEITMADLVAAYETHKKITDEMDKAAIALDEDIISWELRKDDCNIIVKGVNRANLRVNREHLRMFVAQLKAGEVAKIEALDAQYKAQ